MGDSSVLWVREGRSVKKNLADPDDYKIFCFDGEPKALFVATEHATGGAKFDFLVNHLPLENGHPNADVTPKRPACYDKMLEMAGTLSADFPQVRVDFYDIAGKPYFGEMTFFHWNGLTPFDSPEYDELFRSWIVLPREGGNR